MMAKDCARAGLRAMAAAMLLVLALGVASAEMYSVQKDQSLYGTLNQHDVHHAVPPNKVADPDISLNACMPTAFVNSLVYLENRYPGTYDSLLIQQAGKDITGDGVYDTYDDWAYSAEVAAGINYMWTDDRIGTYFRDFYYGKQLYIENYAPNRTEYAGEGDYNFIVWRPDQLRPALSWVANRIPTWQFLYGELRASEDVEIGITYNVGGGHALTLTSFNWNDTNNDGTIDLSEGAQIDYMDPWTGAFGLSDIWQTSAGGYIFTDYGGGSRITMDASESPVPVTPELSSGALLLVGALPMGIAWRRRRS